MENDDQVLVESSSTTDRILTEKGIKKITSKESNENPERIIGELQIKGPNVFSQYLNKPDQTKSSFTADGRWFRTGKSLSLKALIYPHSIFHTLN